MRKILTLILLLISIAINAQMTTAKFSQLKNDALRGNAESQFYLASCYYHGYGVSQNKQEAIKWLAKSAEQGYVKAMSLLGQRYSDGDGVTQNYTEAVKWYRKAGEKGDVNAQTLLGILYDDGEGVPRNYKEAVKWFRMAADKGYSVAQCCLAKNYFTGEGVAQSYTEAIKWFRKSAEQGYADAQYWLGNCYYFGNGLQKNESIAMQWYEKAAKQGNKHAITQLGRLQKMNEYKNKSNSSSTTNTPRFDFPSILSINSASFAPPFLADWETYYKFDDIEKALKGKVESNGLSFRKGSSNYLSIYMPIGEHDRSMDKMPKFYNYPTSVAYLFDEKELHVQVSILTTFNKAMADGMERNDSQRDRYITKSQQDQIVERIIKDCQLNDYAMDIDDKNGGYYLFKNTSKRKCKKIAVIVDKTGSVSLSFDYIWDNKEGKFSTK